MGREASGEQVGRQVFLWTPWLDTLVPGSQEHLSPPKAFRQCPLVAPDTKVPDGEARMQARIQLRLQ